MNKLDRDIKNQILDAISYEIALNDNTEHMKLKSGNEKFYIEHVLAGFEEVSKAIFEFITSFDYVQTSNTSRRIEVNMNQHDFFKKLDELK